MEVLCRQVGFTRRCVVTVTISIIGLFGFGSFYRVSFRLFLPSRQLRRRSEEHGVLVLRCATHSYLMVSRTMLHHLLFPPVYRIIPIYIPFLCQLLRMFYIQQHYNRQRLLFLTNIYLLQFEYPSPTKAVNDQITLTANFAAFVVIKKQDSFRRKDTRVCKGRESKSICNR